jgi:hypothetical protein
MTLKSKRSAASKISLYFLILCEKFTRSTQATGPENIGPERPLAGQRLGIKEVEDGIWLISFMHYDLGYIDLEQRTLQTIDNPFGTRLSPMS